MGLPALPVEDPPGGCRCRGLWGSPAAAALLAARVGREGHLHAHLAERRAHAPAQNHGRTTLTDSVPEQPLPLSVETRKPV